MVLPSRTAQVAAEKRGASMKILWSLWVQLALMASFSVKFVRMIGAKRNSASRRLKFSVCLNCSKCFGD